jgi:hypothetical protein
VVTAVTVETRSYLGRLLPMLCWLHYSRTRGIGQSSRPITDKAAGARHCDCCRDIPEGVAPITYYRWRVV